MLPIAEVTVIESLGMEPKGSWVGSWLVCGCDYSLHYAHVWKEMSQWPKIKGKCLFCFVNAYACSGCKHIHEYTGIYACVHAVRGQIGSFSLSLFTLCFETVPLIGPGVQ